MAAQQRIVRERRQYNQWVATQTLEDYALRYTAGSARKSSFRVGNTALGPVAFLACEAIGGSITLAYGFPNAVWAIVAFMVLMFLIGLPIAYYAAKYGVDIDLLTRGAGFGYLGSTLTSLIYASFTFLLFAIEASILSVALQMLFGIPIALAHLISSLVVIPVAESLRHQPADQPDAAIGDAADLAGLASSCRSATSPGNRHPVTNSAWTHFGGHAGLGQRRDGRQLPATVRCMAASVLSNVAAAADRRARWTTCSFLPKRQTGRQAFQLVDGAAHDRTGLDPDWRIQAAGRLFPRRAGAARRREPGRSLAAHADVPGGVSRNGRLTDHGAGADRRVRDRLPAEDQRHQRLCGLDRLVEFFLTPDA